MQTIIVGVDDVRGALDRCGWVPTAFITVRGLQREPLAHVGLPITTYLTLDVLRMTAAADALIAGITGDTRLIKHLIDIARMQGLRVYVERK